MTTLNISNFIWGITDDVLRDVTYRARRQMRAGHAELSKQFSGNPSFRTWLSETVFVATYLTPAIPASVSEAGVVNR